MNLPLCVACNAPLTPAPTGRPRLYCSPRCRKAASRARGRTWEPAPGAPVDADPLTAAFLTGRATAAPTDEQLAVVLLELHATAGSLHRLGREARPRLAWRCEKIAGILDAALATYLPTP